ncbi:thioredoxin family protein [Marinifilum caeruleilacunae]|uniref:Thioredoxin n=1 Tax=Marinifilum caeruleilacunae TaxID=2499076 RepID=A0ABX1WTK2_9BACT|nr:thioredoxin family protein [Marinifilum caeruleilacunae]NOU59331.1 thioredoxin [Marinifilum caeruleilacunae]
MKRLLLVAVMAVISLSVSAQGIQFEHGTFAEALAKAKKENKLLFVDFYTTWCGPCKKMSETIFTQKEVGDYYNKNFISLKVDAEKGEGPKLAEANKVKGFPTMIFFNADGTENKRLVGATPDAGFFISFAKQVTGEEKPFLEQFEAYKKGNRNLDFVRNLILAGGVYASTLPREEQTPWFEKFAEMASWYFVCKQPHEMMNKEDFRLISMYLDGPNNGNPFVEHIYNNYEAWAKVIPNADLSMFIFRTNNQSIHQAYRTGDLKFREYLAAVHGRLAKVYADTPDADAEDTFQIMTMVGESGLCLYKKDLDGVLDWNDKYLAYELAKGEVESYSYNTSAGQLLQAKDAITPAHAKRVMKILKTGLKKYPGDRSLTISLGEYSALLGDKKTAKECYEKVIEMTKDGRGADYFKNLMEEKLQALK